MYRYFNAYFSVYLNVFYASEWFVMCCSTMRMMMKSYGNFRPVPVRTYGNFLCNMVTYLMYGYIS